MSPSSLAFAKAASALPATVVSRIGVLWRELVAMAAMCFSRMAGRWSCAAQDVLAAGDRFKMGRIHAVANAAKMVERQSGRDRADEQLVRKAMSTDGAGPVPRPECTIAPGVDRPVPEPATSRLLNECPEAVCWVTPHCQSHCPISAEHAPYCRPFRDGLPAVLASRLRHVAPPRRCRPRRGLWKQRPGLLLASFYRSHTT